VIPSALPADLADRVAEFAAVRGPFGASVVYYESIGSTNDVAAGLAEGGAPEGTLVVAGEQTEGRGRERRTWVSLPGAGLYFSIVFRPHRPGGSGEMLLSLAAGLVIAEAVERASGLQALIKWPNDLVVGGGGSARPRRKLAGILAEGTSAGSGLQHVIVGIGINLRPGAWPEDLRNRVTSIESETGRPADAGLVLAECLAGFARWRPRLVEGDRRAVLDAWMARSPMRRGARVSLARSVRVVGTTEGLDEHGSLLVRTSAGLERVVSGEVIWD
jgi:BirA family biotin operon repressor/biotin-[acetyl-CoA-carboxylase] ligase